jgi:hypothetical protein
MIPRIDKSFLHAVRMLSGWKVADSGPETEVLVLAARFFTTTPSHLQLGDVTYDGQDSECRWDTQNISVQVLGLFLTL